MPDDSPASPRTPTPRNARWWRLGGLTLDTVLLPLLIQGWNLPVVSLAQSLVGGGSPTAEGVRIGTRGFVLLGTEGDVLALGFTALIIALQVPFLLRSSTMGMALCGVELRLNQERAPLWTTLVWVALAWTLTLMGAYGFMLFLAAFAPNAGLLSLVGFALLAIPLVNLFVGMRSGASILDRLLAVTVGGRQPSQPTGDHLGGWKPRKNPPRIWSSTVDDDAKLWRQHRSPDPLAPFLGPAVAPAPEPPAEPEHAVYLSADDPYAAVGGVVEADPEERELVERLREAAKDAPD